MKDVNNINANYLSAFFIWVLFWIFAILIFICIIDPYGVSPIQINIPKFNIHKPKRIDIDRLIKPYEVLRYQPKTIFIGTSRIHQSMNPAILNNTNFFPAYNAAIPASSLAQNVDNIEQFLKLDPNIKHIFIELFLYNFINPGNELHPKTMKEMMTNYISLQISSDALFAAIQTVYANIKKGPSPAHIGKGGNYVYGSDFNPAYTFSDELFIKTVIQWDHDGKMSLQEGAFKTLDRIVDLARHHGVTLHFFLTPNYPWDDYRLMTLGYWPMLEAWLRRMAAYPNVTSFSQYNDYLTEKPTLNPKMKWWSDPIHFSANMGEAMMKAYLGHYEKGMPKNLARSLNSKTVENIIAERHKQMLHWAATHQDFVALFEKLKKTHLA